MRRNAISEIYINMALGQELTGHRGFSNKLELDFVDHDMILQHRYNLSRISSDILAT